MELNQRIFKARSDAKLTQEELARAVGKTRGAVAQWESGEVQPRRSTLEAIAAATGKSIHWLERGVDVDTAEIAPSSLEVVGEVSAGTWKESTYIIDRVFEPVSPHPEYPSRWQRLYRVVGDSMNKVAGPGEYLHTVEILNGGIVPEHGDLVVVRRMQHGLAEYTAKQMIWDESHWVLRPLSTNPAWQNDIVLNGDDDTTIEVTDLIIARWSPIKRRSLIPT